MGYKAEKLTLDGQPIAGPRCFTYADTGNNLAAVVAAGFFTNGADHGMVVGDEVIYRDLTLARNYRLRVVSRTDTGNSQVTVAEDTT